MYLARANTALANLANLPGEPFPESRVRRLVHHAHDSVSVLYVFLVLAHERRRIVHFAVDSPSYSRLEAHQLWEAFPWETAPRCLLRDRDPIFGHEFVNQVRAMGYKQVLSATLSLAKGLY